MLALLVQALEIVRRAIDITEGPITLPASLSVPDEPRGLVLFAHGSGSSRLSPRNQQVANALNQAGLATLLFDLLTEDESRHRSRVFDIPLLAERLALATRWALRQRGLKNLRLGYFGASTGAAAALIAAAELGNRISAVVSRGGRPDLAIPRLSSVKAPTLLIVGGDDEPTLSLNQEAQRLLSNGKLLVLPGATHLFEEPGALERVAREACSWFTRHLSHAPFGDESAA